ncbi:MAG: NTP transferase domain-containing protein [Candidatus Nitrospinota bacterium M3_3B_026]
MGGDYRPGAAANGKVDALLFCGDAGASRAIEGKSKAYLAIDGVPLFVYVLRALDGVERIRRVFMVGDKRRLDADLSIAGPIEKPVVTIEQGAGLLENAWKGFLASLDGYTPGAERENQDFKNRVIFALGADSPLITAAEIGEFFDRADMSRYDYVAGLTPKEALDRFRPRGGRPGIKMAYFHVREGLFRINNMHMARPFAFAVTAPVQMIYNHRYQKKIRNIIRLFMGFLAPNAGWSKLRLYLLMQAAMFSRNIGLPGLADRIRRRVPIDEVMEAVGDVLGLRAGYAVTKQGGAALDIDNEKDYIAMKRMFAEWKTAR